MKTPAPLPPLNRMETDSILGEEYPVETFGSLNNSPDFGHYPASQVHALLAAIVERLKKIERNCDDGALCLDVEELIAELQAVRK